jgi:glycosyltransferase involved in cell wall biosynthesis
MTKVIASVTNDLSTDQRVHKVCTTLLAAKYEVLLVGRKLRKSPDIDRPYETKRLCLLFNSGFLFYAFYNIRLFFFLLSKRCDIVLANDLDTLLACYTAAKLKGVPVIYDTHEYFCGMPELTNKPFARSVWRGIERCIFPKLETVITVNQSVADLYKEEYNTELTVIRNYPMTTEQRSFKSKEALGIPSGTRVILYQGAVNVDRGLEEAVEAMQWIENAVLVIVGGGNAFQSLEKLVAAQEYSDRIILRGWLPFTELIDYTAHADIGLAIEKGNNLNYKYSLSNKLFDYIQSGLPILSSRLVENERLMAKWEIGTFIDNHEAKHISRQISYMLSDEGQRTMWKENLEKAKQAYTWEGQQAEMLAVYDTVLQP